MDLPMTACPASPKLATAARSARARQRVVAAPLLTERRPAQRPRYFDIISDDCDSLLHRRRRISDCHRTHGAVPGATSGFSQVTRRAASLCERECGVEIRFWGSEPMELHGAGAA